MIEQRCPYCEHKYLVLLFQPRRHGKSQRRIEYTCPKCGKRWIEWRVSDEHVAQKLIDN